MSISITDQPRRARVLTGRLAVAAGLAAGLAVVLAACDNDTPTGAALDQASVKLSGMVPAGAAAPSGEHRQEIFQQVGSTLSQSASQGTDSENAAAAILLAETKIGQGQIAAAAAANAESRALKLARQVRAALSDWTVRSARAEAAAQYDPAPELADLQSQIDERREQIEQERRSKAEVEAQVAELRTQAQAKLDQSKAHRREEGLLRQRSLEASATQGAELLEQATDQKRRGDALEVEAGNLEARASLIEPQIAEIDLSIGRLQKQIELLEAARQEVSERAAASQASAQQAREAASAAAADVDTLLAELSALRTGELAQKLEEAVRHFEGAARDAKSATSATRTTANLTVGTAQQELGGVLRLQAQGWSDHAALLEALAGATPAMPSAQTYRAAAEEARAQAKASLEASNAAYAAAQSAYKGAGAKGEAQDRLSAIGDRLGSLAGVPADEVAPTDDGGAAEEPATGDGEVAAASDSPQAAVDAMLDSVRQGQYGAIGEYLHVENPANRQALDAIVSVVEGFGRVDQAFKGQFGKGLIELGMEQVAASGGQIPGLPPGTDPQALVAQATGGLAGMSSADFQWQVEGDRATAIPTGGAGQPILMRQVDGRWLIDLSEIEGMLEAEPQADKYRELISFGAPLLADALAQAAGEIEAGQYQTAEVAVNAVNLKVQPAVMQIMGKMQELGIQLPMGPGEG